MDYELELTKANRLKLSRAFHNHKRVDFAIDCVIEGQMGKAFVDNLVNPVCYRINVGPFWYFAGEAHSCGGYQMMKDFPAYHLLMPSPSDWIDVAKEIYGQYLQPFSRYTFSAESLSSRHLANCLEASEYQLRIIPVNAKIAAQLIEMPESYLELSDFESIQDFVERGMGYTILDGNSAIGVAYSSLVCSTGIEVSIYVEEAYRQKGVATALGSKILLECLNRNLRPNRDAANPESCKLAKRLGYTFVETYDAYYHTLNENSQRQKV